MKQLPIFWPSSGIIPVEVEQQIQFDVEFGKTSRDQYTWKQLWPLTSDKWLWMGWSFQKWKYHWLQNWFAVPWLHDILYIPFLIAKISPGHPGIYTVSTIINLAGPAQPGAPTRRGLHVSFDANQIVNHLEGGWKLPDPHRIRTSGPGDYTSTV